MNLFKVDSLFNLLNQLLLKAVKSHKLAYPSKKLISVLGYSSTGTLVPHLADGRVDFSNQRIDCIAIEL